MKEIKDILAFFFILIFIAFMIAFSLKVGLGLADWLYRLIFRA